MSFLMGIAFPLYGFETIKTRKEGKETNGATWGAVRPLQLNEAQPAEAPLAVPTFRTRGLCPCVRLT
jgi:hypothetical protein